MKLKNLGVLALSGVILLLVHVSESKADTNSTSKNQSTTQVKKEEKSPFGMGFLLSVNSSLQPPSHADHSVGSDLWLMPSYSLTKELKLGGLIILSRDFTGEEKSSVSDLKFTLRHSGLEMNPYLKFSPAVSVKAPTNEDSVRRNSFQGAMSVEPRLLYDLAPLGFKLSGFHQLSYTRNYHEFYTSTKGESNNQHTIAYRLNMDIVLIGPLSIGADFIRYFHWTYFGNQKDAYEMSQDLTYKFNEKLSASIGLSNEGNLLGADGTGAEVKLIDEKTSTVSGSLSLTL